MKIRKTRKSLLCLLLWTVAITGSSLGGQQPRKFNSILRAEKPSPSETEKLILELGPCFQAATCEHFIIVHDCNAGEILEVARILERAYTDFYSKFSAAGFKVEIISQPLTWIFFANRDDFNRYALRTDGMDVSRLSGYYSTRTNRVGVVGLGTALHEERALPSQSIKPSTIAENAILGLPSTPDGSSIGSDVARITHELAHQLSFNSGLQKRGIMYPRWVSEGLATCMEFDGPVPCEVRQTRSGNSRRLAQARQATALIPLEQFIRQSRVPNDPGMESQWYAQACALFHFFLTERPAQLQAYLRTIAEFGPGPRRPEELSSEFAAAFGHPDNIEQTWLQYIASAPLLAANAGNP